MAKDLSAQALDYHKFPRPGKISVTPTKPLSLKHHLALAYTPGVAVPCEVIAQDPSAAADYTARGNLVAVITNGTAVLGLGNIGPLAAKPVMEGKGVLFKKFAGLDVFDIEIQESDPDKLIEIIASLEPTFGGINLEDIKAPECFYIEKALKARMKIPVFHDDQHGTAIVVVAAMINALKLVNKPIEQVKLVTSGAGAAAIACIELLLQLGLQQENMILTDLEGVIYTGRPNLTDPTKLRFAADTDARGLSDAIKGADVFLGLSAANVLKGEMVQHMAPNPIIFALANPTPEILPEVAKQVRPDAIIATGRSDYPNQINNVLCFPFIFRGALDVGAQEINHAMKLACVKALAELVHQPIPKLVQETYPDELLQFGPEYIIPKPFDPRLLANLAPPVAQAALDSGVATRMPAENMAAYARKLHYLITPSLLQNILPQQERHAIIDLVVETESHLLNIPTDSTAKWRLHGNKDVLINNLAIRPLIESGHIIPEDLGPSALPFAAPSLSALSSTLRSVFSLEHPKKQIGMVMTHSLFDTSQEINQLLSELPHKAFSLTLGSIDEAPLLCASGIHQISEKCLTPLLEKAVAILEQLGLPTTVMPSQKLPELPVALEKKITRLPSSDDAKATLLLPGDCTETLQFCRTLRAVANFSPLANFYFIDSLILVVFAKRVTSTEIFDITSLVTNL